MLRIPKKRLLLLAALLAALFYTPPVQAVAKKQTVVLSAIANEHTHAAAIVILREAYRRIGYSVEVELLPGKRALAEANAGNTEGDVARIGGTEKTFQNLIPVPTPIILFQGGAFTKSVKKDVATWADISEFTVGIIRGIRYSEIGTQGMERIVARDMPHLFQLLDHGRIDVAIAVVRAGEIEATQNFPKSGIHLLGKPIFTAPLYHLVHKKNAHLVPLLDSALKEMSASGLLEKFYTDSLHPLTDKK